MIEVTALVVEPKETAITIKLPEVVLEFHVIVATSVYPPELPLFVCTLVAAIRLPPAKLYRTLCSERLGSQLSLGLNQLIRNLY